MADSNKLNLNSLSVRLIRLDRLYLKLIDRLKFLLLAVSSRLKKFLLGVGLALIISSIAYLFGVFLYRDYFPIYLSSLNPVETIAPFAIGCGFSIVLIGESFCKNIKNNLTTIINIFLALQTF
jgi:hypothetical protein